MFRFPRFCLSRFIAAYSSRWFEENHRTSVDSSLSVIFLSLPFSWSLWNVLKELYSFLTPYTRCSSLVEIDLTNCSSMTEESCRLFIALNVHMPLTLVPESNFKIRANNSFLPQRPEEDVSVLGWATFGKKALTTKSSFVSFEAFFCESSTDYFQAIETVTNSHADMTLPCLYVGFPFHNCKIMFWFTNALESFSTVFTCPWRKELTFQTFTVHQLIVIH